MATEAAVLAKLRRICLALPEARETTTFGHPTFQAGKRTFAVLDDYRGKRVLALKLEKGEQEALCADPRFFPAPYGGAQGWTCLETGGRLDWHEVERLCRASYRLVALQRMLAALDAAPARKARRG